MGGQLERLLAGEEPADLGPAPGPEAVAVDALLDRVHTFLVASLGQGFVGPASRRRRWRSPSSPATWATTRRRQRSAAGSSSLIDDRGDYRPGGPERPARFATGLPLMVLAAMLARTPDVPLPPLPD